MYLPARDEIIWSSNRITCSTVLNNFLLSIEKGELVNYNLLTGDILWKIQVENLQIQYFLGIYNNILWIILSSEELTGINIESGNIEFNGINMVIKSGGITSIPRSIQLDIQCGEITGFSNTFFTRINLNNNINPVKEDYDLSTTMFKNQIEASFIGDFPMDRQYIYFCDDRRGKIGILDRAKLEVVRSYELDMKKGGISQIREMKVAGNRWYVQDRHNTLHIFERE
jgi:hypothetical protein